MARQILPKGGGQLRQPGSGPPLTAPRSSRTSRQACTASCMATLTPVALTLKLLTALALPIWARPDGGGRCGAPPGHPVRFNFPIGRN